MSDPRFGKPQRCQNPVHTVKTVVQLGSLSQIHPADLGIRLRDIKSLPGNEKMIEACTKMLRQPYGWLYLHGPSGNAKTVALKALCNHLSLAGYRPVVYIKFTRLVEIIRAANAAQYAKHQQLSKDGRLDEVWDNGPLDTYNRLLGIKVLAIEEFDKARATALMEEFRFDFLDDRYEQALRGETITMFASQTPPEDMPAPLSSRITDGRFMVVFNEADDTRPAMSRGDEAVCLP